MGEPDPASASATTSRIASAVRDAIGADDPLAIAAALHCVRPDDLEPFFHARLAPTDAVALTVGLPASPGAATGRIVLTADDALAAADRGDAVILVRPETTPDDVLGMQAACGIVTARGGLVSHAAVVARGWGVPAVVGAIEIHVDESGVSIGDRRLLAGDEVTIDGGSGAIYAGALPTRGATAPAELDTLLAWADVVADGHVEVRANADTASDASQGRRHGARGIGLCRTEHMFLAADRLPIMRRFILSDDPDSEAAALAELERAQVADFESVLEAMDGLPVTVRLLDPPLHEFLPDLTDLTERAARSDPDDAATAELTAVRRMHETNPMIGTRGVRLGMVRPGLYEMQVRALCIAAADLLARGRQPRIEIMIPLVVAAEELRLARTWVTGVLDEIGHPELASGLITIGAMIETPRAALVAGDLAPHADFFSFGTNDLTQLTYAFSRDDVESKLLPTYLASGVLPANPFAVLDEDGVGRLIQLASASARAASPSIKLGACGEHAGHPASAAFLVRHGIDSVSCSPFRVPLARLGVAQALLACGRVDLEAIDPDRFRAATASTTSSEPEPSTPTSRRSEAHDAHDGHGDSDAARSTPAGSVDAVDAIDADEALVLHVLRVRGFVTTAGFAESLGVTPDSILRSLITEGLVRHVEARDLFGLLPAGKARHAELLDDLISAAGLDRLDEPYQRFLEINSRFKQLCTDWQIREGQPNDHSDTEHDRRCTEALAALAADARPVLADLAAVVPRLGRYANRLATAAARVSDGDTARFTGVMCESFHDIWMELHEDLMVLQRVERVTEGSF